MLYKTNNSGLWIPSFPKALIPSIKIQKQTALHHIASQFPYSDKFREDFPPPVTPPLFYKFISLGVSINTTNNLGETPILNFISSPTFLLEDLKLFKDNGADLKVRNKKVQGLLHAVAAKKDCETEDVESRSSLDVAAASGSVGILEIFRREG